MNVSFTPQAEDDLLAIAQYIAQDSPARAHSFVDEMRVHAAGLAQFPESRPRVSEIGKKMCAVPYLAITTSIIEC